MPDATFANGQTLTSTAQTPDTFVAIFQTIIAQILGFQPAADPDGAYSAVRVQWQQDGQPAFGIDQDVCSLRATPVDAPISRVRDSIQAPNDAVSLTRKMGYTQAWALHGTLYGPNCADRARLIVSTLSLDWVHDALVAYGIYAIPEWHRPTYIKELFQGQWWPRADIDLQFNELVLESTFTPTAAGLDITIITDTGVSREFQVG